MADNPELALKLGSPVGESSEDAMRKVTGRIPLLPVKEQEKLYALLESEYNDYIAQLEVLGGSGLEARSLPLDASRQDGAAAQAAALGSQGHPQFAAIYNRQLRRVDERRSAVLAAMRRAPQLFDADAGKRLNADEERQLGEMSWKAV